MKGRGVSKEVLIYSAGPWIEERQWTWRWLCVFAPVCVGGGGGPCVKCSVSGEGL